MFDADALAETLLNGKPQSEYTLGKDPSITFKVHRIEYMGSTDNPQGVLEFEKAQIKDCFEDLSNMKNFMGDDYEEVRKEILKVISDEL